MNEVVIVEPVRTPVGRFGGSLSRLSALELATQVVRGLIDRTGLPPAAVDEVVFGNCYPSMDAPALGRVVGLDAGLPVTTAGVQVDRRCGSGLQAVLDAASRVALGVYDLAIAGGAESMSRAPFYSHDVRKGPRGEALRLDDALARGRVTAGGRHHPIPGGMIETAENVRAEYRISRLEQDELAVSSHRRATAAQRTGVFDEEIIPVVVRTRRGEETVWTDEHPRSDISLDALGALRAIRLDVDPDATVTAGNASGQNDGAAACIVTTPDRAGQLGLRPLARLVGWSLAGVAPETMGIGPVPAVARVLDRTGLKLADLDLIELNEAFAAQVIACAREWGFGPVGASDWDRVNVHGSGISLGHPVGATGARIMATMLRELDRRRDRFALETMCIGGGQGLAAVFERWTGD